MMFREQTATDAAAAAAGSAEVAKKAAVAAAADARALTLTRVAERNECAVFGKLQQALQGGWRPEPGDGGE